mmetsp:Transcript_56935/g.83543  ORF Transcript_56935/g.83543 Transcript_56935/m.83543 type:complete len:84 (+) Transcript_56935:3-254(+)
MRKLLLTLSFIASTPLLARGFSGQSTLLSRRNPTLAAAATMDGCDGGVCKRPSEGPSEQAPASELRLKGGGARVVFDVYSDPA